MKLHLLFLVCLVVGSWQQNPHFPYHANQYPVYPSYHYQFLENPLPYSPAFVEELIEQRNLAVYRLLEAKGLLKTDRDEQNNHDENDQEVEARFLNNKEDKAESRGAALFLPALLLGSALYGSTSTKYSFVTSTLTSTSTISCIPSGSFTAGSSTVACRKRRDVALLHDLLADVVPTETLGVEPTREPDFMRTVRDNSNDVVSSMKEEESNRQARAFGIGVNRLYSTVFATYTTSTVTTYTFTTTLSKKTVSIGSSLLCMPLGYSVC